MTNTTASIDLAQLDALDRRARDEKGEGYALMAIKPTIVRDLIALARRSLTSGAPAEPALDADEMTRLRRLMKALGHDDAFQLSDDYVRGVLCTTLGQAAGSIEAAYAGLAAPVHDAAAPSAELIDLLKAIRPSYGAVGSRDVDVAAQQKRIDRAIELLSAGAAAKTEQEATCEKCNGSGIVDDGEIDCYPNGEPYENGPVMCVTDCPCCKGSGRATASGAGSAQPRVDEIHIGMSNNDQDVHISIVQQHADRTSTVIFTAKVPAGDSFARAALARAPLPAQGGAQTQAARDVLAERQRQVEAEGWKPGHDDCYRSLELNRAAACYISFGSDTVPSMWPWPQEWWKPTNYRRNMVKAGALVLAEIERLDRAAMRANDSAAEGGKSAGA